MARRQREFNGKTFSDDGTGKLYNEELKKYLIYRPYPLLVDEVNESDKIEPDNKQEYTSKQLKDKFGTDDTSLINTGKEKEEQVSKVEDKKEEILESIKNAKNQKELLELRKQGENITGEPGTNNWDDEFAKKFDEAYQKKEREMVENSEKTIQPDKVWDDEVLKNKSDYELARPNETKLNELLDNGIIYEEDVNEMALKYVDVDTLKDAMRVLDYDIEKYTDKDSIFNDGSLDDSDLDRIGREVLAGMPDDDIGDLMRVNGIDDYLEDEEENYNIPEKISDEKITIFNEMSTKDYADTYLDGDLIKAKIMTNQFGKEERLQLLKDKYNGKTTLNNTDFTDQKNYKKLVEITNQMLEERNEKINKLREDYKSHDGVSDDYYTNALRKESITDEEIAKMIYERKGAEANNSSDDNIKRLLAKMEKEKWQRLYDETERQLKDENISDEMRSFLTSGLKAKKNKLDEFTNWEKEFERRLNRR